MVVERFDNEILVKIPAKMSSARIQSLLDYLRYEELTSDSIANQEDIDKLCSEAKKGRWERIKKLY